jgi:hypothetical protein
MKGFFKGFGLIVLWLWLTGVFGVLGGFVAFLGIIILIAFSKGVFKGVITELKGTATNETK